MALGHTKSCLEAYEAYLDCICGADDANRVQAKVKEALGTTDEESVNKILEVVRVETVPLERYTEALDEIWHLRRALAYEASVAEGHGTYKTFPKTRQRFLADQVERLRASARGEVQRAYAGIRYSSLDDSLKDAGARPTLTRTQWEHEKPRRKRRR